MELKDATSICKEMQKWRRGEGIYDGETPAPMPFTPETFGIAIDKLIEHAEGKIDPLLADCLKRVDPEVRAEVRKNMNADHFRDTMQMVADPDDLWVEWYTENADKLTISCYADETLSHCSFVAGYRAHEALQLAVLSLEGIQDGRDAPARGNLHRGTETI